MRRPIAEMPLRMAVSMPIIMLLDVSGRPCPLLAISLRHATALDGPAVCLHLSHQHGSLPATLRQGCLQPHQVHESDWMVLVGCMTMLR